MTGITGTTGVTGATGPAGATQSSATLTISRQDNYQRFTITDAAVSAASHINASITRPFTTEVADAGWFYTVNVVSQTTGSFDIVVYVSMWGENADADLVSAAPGETLTFVYSVS